MPVLCMEKKKKKACMNMGKKIQIKKCVISTCTSEVSQMQLKSWLKGKGCLTIYLKIYKQKMFHSDLSTLTVGD